MSFHDKTDVPLNEWTDDELHEWATFLADKMNDTGASSSDTERLEAVVNELKIRGKWHGRFRDTASTTRRTSDPQVIRFPGSH